MLLYALLHLRVFHTDFSKIVFLEVWSWEGPACGITYILLALKIVCKEIGPFVVYHDPLKLASSLLLKRQLKFLHNNV